MKLTPNELNKVLFDTISKMNFKDELTGREGMLYLKMRGNAFYSDTKKERNPCMKGTKVLSEELDAGANVVHPRLKSLEKKGLIKPKYFLRVGGKIQGFNDFKFVDKHFGRINIKYIEYTIFDLPGEKKAIKEYKKKKKARKK